MITFQGIVGQGPEQRVGGNVDVDARAVRLVRAGRALRDGRSTTALDLEIGERARTLYVLGDVEAVSASVRAALARGEVQHG